MAFGIDVDHHQPCLLQKRLIDRFRDRFIEDDHLRGPDGATYSFRALEASCEAVDPLEWKALADAHAAAVLHPAVVADLGQDEFEQRLHSRLLLRSQPGVPPGHCQPWGSAR